MQDLKLLVCINSTTIKMPAQIALFISSFKVLSVFLISKKVPIYRLAIIAKSAH